MRRQIDQKEREEIIRLRLEGLRYSIIAVKTGRPSSTVRRICNEANIENHSRRPHRRTRRDRPYGIGIFLLPNRKAHFRYESCIIKTKD